MREQGAAMTYRANFFVAGIPVAKPRPRPGKFGNVYSPRPKSLKAWEQALYAEMIEHLPKEPLTGPVLVDLHFLFPRPKSHYTSKGKLKTSAPMCHIIKPDRDNLEKPVLDVGSVKTKGKGSTPHAGIWADDKLVCAGGFDKTYTTYQYPDPGCLVYIEELWS